MLRTQYSVLPRPLLQKPPWLDSLVGGMHLPFPGIGRLRSDGKNAYTWAPIEYSPIPASPQPDKMKKDDAM